MCWQAIDSKNLIKSEGLAAKIAKSLILVIDLVTLLVTVLAAVYATTYGWFISSELGSYYYAVRNVFVCSDEP